MSKSVNSIHCECGGHYTQKNKSRHINSKRHQEYKVNEEDDDGFENCECGYTHHYEDKCPIEKQCEKYVKWRKDE